MKSSTTTSNIRPYNSKQLLFEEEQKKRAAKRDSVLGNLQSTGAAAPRSSAAQTKPAAQGGIVQTKPASLISSGKQNSGGIIQMKPNAFSPNARTANAAAGMVKSDNSSTVRMQSTGSTGNLQKPRRTPNMTRGEAWGMLENERKDKRSFSVPSGFSEQGKDVFMQLMELPDWGLDNEKKDEKVVELNSSYPLPNKSFTAKHGSISYEPKYIGNGEVNDRQYTSGLGDIKAAKERPLETSGYVPSTEKDLNDRQKTRVTDLPSVSELKRDYGYKLMSMFQSPPSIAVSIKNYQFNSEHDVVDRYVYGQEVDSAAAMKYGKSTVSVSGCGPLAAFNALNHFGFSVPLSKVIYFMERNGAVAGGKYGTVPDAITLLLQTYGMELDVYDSFRGFQNEVQPGDAFILGYWNEAASATEVAIDDYFEAQAEIFEGTATTETLSKRHQASQTLGKKGFMDTMKEVLSSHYVFVVCLPNGDFAVYNPKGDATKEKIVVRLKDIIEEGMLFYAVHIQNE